MREGVIRDIQRQEMKKRQNIKMLQDQIDLTVQLKAIQQQEAKNSVKDTETASSVGRT